MGKLKREVEPAAFGVGHLDLLRFVIRASGPVAQRLEQGTHIETAWFSRVCVSSQNWRCQRRTRPIAAQTRFARLRKFARF